MFVFSTDHVASYFLLIRGIWGPVPRFWKRWLPGQESRSLKCAFFFCSFLPVSLLSLIVTSVLGPMPNDSALTPQYTQACTAEQSAMQRTQRRNVFPNQAPANNFCLREEAFGFIALLESCAQLTPATSDLPRGMVLQGTVTNLENREQSR